MHVKSIRDTQTLLLYNGESFLIVTFNDRLQPADEALNYGD